MRVYRYSPWLAIDRNIGMLSDITPFDDRENQHYDVFPEEVAYHVAFEVLVLYMFFRI